jgi:hypothetical protein
VLQAGMCQGQLCSRKAVGRTTLPESAPDRTTAGKPSGWAAVELASSRHSAAEPAALGPYTCGHEGGRQQLARRPGLACCSTGFSSIGLSRPRRFHSPTWNWIQPPSCRLIAKSCRALYTVSGCG